MSIKIELDARTRKMQAILEAANAALLEKNGTAADSVAEIPSAIAALPSGAGAVSVDKKDVNFYDCDGTRLYSYTLEDAAALTELPKLPARDGLICQGWNWSLEDIKAMGRAVDVGAVYITGDGATRLHIHIAAEGRMTVPLHFNQTVENGVSIDWGDGSAAETLAASGKVNTSHTYAQPGDYVISLLPNEDCTLQLGASSSSYCVLGSTADAGRVYRNMLRAVHYGKNVTSVGNYTFCGCSALEAVTLTDAFTAIEVSSFEACSFLDGIIIPHNVRSIGSGAFSDCTSLRGVVIPNSVTFIGTYAFSGCASLASIVLSNSVTSIRINCFENCFSLASIVIPVGVTAVAAKSFYSCVGMRFYDFSGLSAVPTLSAATAIEGIPADCEILVPAALYDTWIAANNWSGYAGYIVAV